MKLIISVLDTRIKNKTSKVKVNVLEQVFSKFLAKNHHFKNVKEVNLTLTLCGKIKIKKLNKEFRAIDKATDVLSFGVHENLRPDKLPILKSLPTLDLGDIFICKDVAKKQAQNFDITYEQEIYHLATHGFLHLLGFDHEISNKEEKIMEAFEAKIVSAVYKKLGPKGK